MRFAVSYSPPHHGVDPDRLVGYARHAEECGFEGLYLPEHIALHPGATFGPMEVPPTLPFLDPLDCLAFVAAATERLLLGTGVLLPYRHPVVLAKRLATIDVLSRGRMRLLTVGLGTPPREAAALGDGYFPGGLLVPDERARQLGIARAAAVEAGRDPAALEYTRWGSIDMSTEKVAALAEQGVTRLVVSAASADPHQQREELSAFAERFGLGVRTAG